MGEAQRRHDGRQAGAGGARRLDAVGVRTAGDGDGEVGRGADHLRGDEAAQAEQAEAEDDLGEFAGTTARRADVMLLRLIEVVCGQPHALRSQTRTPGPRPTVAREQRAQPRRPC